MPSIKKVQSGRIKVDPVLTSHTIRLDKFNINQSTLHFSTKRKSLTIVASIVSDTEIRFDIVTKLVRKFYVYYTLTEYNKGIKVQRYTINKEVHK